MLGLSHVSDLAPWEIPKRKDHLSSGIAKFSKNEHSFERLCFYDKRMMKSITPGYIFKYGPAMSYI